jgi:2-dehydropantoate 2-reductase
MKICFFGVGGVGGYFGSLITRKFGDVHDFYFIARGSHKDAICTKGLTLKKDGGKEVINIFPKMCTERAADLPICDIVVLSVKSYDLANAAKEISEIANEKTVILPLLNGVDIYERIKEQLRTGIVLPSCVYVGTHIESPGVIYQKGGSCKIALGKDPDFPDFYPGSLLTLLKESGIDFDWEEDVKISIWSKYMFIAAYGLVTAAYEKTLGEVLDDPELSRMTKAIISEIENIAKQLHVSLNSDAGETAFLKATQFPYETKTSFQRDVELKGRINEGDLYGGTLIRYGEALRIPTPNIRNIYESLLRKVGP